MNDLSLIYEVIAYYELDDHPYRYYIQGMLQAKAEESAQWASLNEAYLSGEFRPADVKFMYEFVNR